MGPNFPSHTVEYVKLKVKTIRTRYAAEPAKMTKSEKSGSSLNGVHGRERERERERELLTMHVCCISATSRQLLTVALKGGSAIEVWQNCKFGTISAPFPLLVRVLDRRVLSPGLVRPAVHHYPFHL